MIETGKIKEINGAFITVACDDKGACKSCGNTFCSRPNHEFTAINSKQFDLKPGDIVDVYLPPGKIIKAGFILLILPLILFIVFYLIAKAILGKASDNLSALFGTAGIIVGLLFCFFYNLMKKNKEFPEITSVK